MRNIDKELIKWAINKIETEFNGEISLLLGRKGACKIPTDEDEIAFDFFIPAMIRDILLLKHLLLVIWDMIYFQCHGKE